jgi:DNA-binding MarR family transcriptional regulator
MDALALRLAHGLSRAAVAIELASTGDPHGAPLGERTVAQQLVLLYLRHRQQACALPDLADEVAMTVEDTVAAVSTLVNDGLVAMDPTPSYAPAEMRVTLTDSGWAESPDLLNWAVELLSEIDRLNPDEQRELLRLVVERILGLQRAGQIPVARMCLTCRFFDPHAYPSGPQPHHCHLVNAPFGHRQLRLHCPDQRPSHRA